MQEKNKSKIQVNRVKKTEISKYLIIVLQWLPKQRNKTKILVIWWYFKQNKKVNLLLLLKMPLRL